MTDTLKHPAQGNYRHGDGGLYCVTGPGRSSADGSPVVVYRHLWPFEQDTWVRPLAEWHSRFTPINDEDYLLATSGNRAAAQVVVTEKRTARKGLTAK